MRPVPANNVFPIRNLGNTARVHEGGVRAPPLHPLPLPKRDPGAGRIVVKVAQDPTPLYSGIGAPTGAVRGRSAKREGGGSGRYYRWEPAAKWSSRLGSSFSRARYLDVTRITRMERERRRTGKGRGMSRKKGVEPQHTDIPRGRGMRKR